jgi:hypothetical protein
MPYYTHTVNTIGCFTEKDHGQYFEYSNNTDRVENCSEWCCFPHLVWVGDTAGGAPGYRYATVKKTVAYIVVDEDESGRPVIEKWQLKKNNPYEVLEVTNPELILDPSKPAYMIRTV